MMRLCCSLLYSENCLLSFNCRGDTSNEFIFRVLVPVGYPRTTHFGLPQLENRLHAVADSRGLFLCDSRILVGDVSGNAMRRWPEICLDLLII